MSNNNDFSEPKEDLHTFIAYFDILGFECLVDITSYERHKLLAEISGIESNVKTPVNLRFLTMRARANPHRSPEIWIFTSLVDEATLVTLSQEDPQALADLIRKVGKSVWKPASLPNPVIK